MEVKFPATTLVHEEIKSPSNDNLLTTLDQSLSQIIKREGLLKCEIDKRCVSSNGSSYLGTLYEIKLKGKSKYGDKELNIFVKEIINLKVFPMLSVSKIYETELFIYKELSKVYAVLQKEADVPIDERYKMVTAYDESNPEVIIMENMAVRGYFTGSRMDVMSLQFAERAVAHLARFHALSFVLREKRPDYFKTRIKTMDIPTEFNDAWQELIESSRDLALAHIDEKYKKYVKVVYDALDVQYPQYGSDETAKICLCHGDYKVNNIMMKMEEGEIQDIIPVDYQHTHCGCPIVDFSFFIFTGTDREFRKAHLSDLKHLYYETLSNFLKYFDLDPDTVYSRNDFEQAYKKRFDFGIMYTMMFLPFFLTSEENAPDPTSNQAEVTFYLDDLYKNRLRGLIEDYVEWNHL